jgi:hypothetical protein
MRHFTRITQLLSVFALLQMSPSVSVAQLPINQVYAFDMERDGAGYSFSKAKLLTAFNPRGYNNQPQWVNNNELYLAVQTPYDTAQTDIVSLSLAGNILTRVTATAESEYSPLLSPDRRSFSCVRVDAGGAGLQRLWSYPLDRSNQGKDLLPLHQGVGYYCWLSPQKVALFIVSGSDNYLKIANVEDQSSIQLSGGIGRSLARMNDGKLAYIQKATPQTWYIKALDPVSYNSTIIAETLPNSEDFALLPDGTFLMGYGSKLYSFSPLDPDKQWREVGDFAKYGLMNIKRLAVSREVDKIAIVTDIPHR